MNLKQLEAFDAFMSHGSTTRSAAALKMSQPMVSRLLIQLEENIGFPLFERKRNQLIPTHEAIMFHARVSHSLTIFQELEREARSIANRQVGRIIIAAQPIYVDTFLLDVITRFKQEHPKVGVKIIDAGLEELLRMFNDGSCDIGVGITLDASIYGASLIPLGTCSARCLMRQDHRLAKKAVISLEDLRQETFVDLALGSPLRTRVDYMMQTIGTTRKIAAEARTLRVVHGLVERGVGVAIVDPFTSLISTKAQIISRPLNPQISWEMAVFHHQNRQLSQIESAFIDTTRAEIGRLREQGVLS